MSNEIPVQSVTNWTIRQVPKAQVLLVQFSFLSHPFQKLEEAQQSPTYALSPQSLRLLIEALEKSEESLLAAIASLPPGSRPQH